MRDNNSCSVSGAGKNLKVGGTDPAQRRGCTGPAQKWGAPIRRQAPEKIFLVVPLHFFGSKSTISRFGERFRNGQYSLVSFLFAVLLLKVPPVPTHL